MEIIIESKGEWKNTRKFLKFIQTWEVKHILEKYAEEGLRSLTDATPSESGKTAECWDYEVEASASSGAIHWTNTNINDGVNIALIIQYGHGLRQGGYVEGTDYINPAIKPVFEALAEEAWKEVTSA